MDAAVRSTRRPRLLQVSAPANAQFKPAEARWKADVNGKVAGREIGKDVSAEESQTVLVHVNSENWNQVLLDRTSHLEV